MKNVSVLLFVLLIVFFMIDNAFADLNDGLVAYYPFNGNANDESGNGNNGTVHGAILTTDRFGNENSAFYFDGIDDFIETSDLDPWYDFTVTGWFKTNENNKYMRIIDKDGGYYIDHWSVTVNTNGMVFTGYKQGSNASTDLWSDEILNDNQWHFFVSKQVNNGYFFYIDGKLDTSAFVPSFTFNNDAKIYVGYSASNQAVVNYYKGAIDDIRIFHRSLSELEIDSLYHEGGWDPSLVAFYPFNGNANDESGNGNNGTIYGAILATDRFGNPNSAMLFDGVDDFIEIPYSEDLEIGGNLTITGWVKVPRNDTIQSIICNRKTSNGHAVYSLAIESKKLQFIDDADTRVVCYYDSLFPVDKWIFVSVRRDRNNHVVYLGLNGNEQSIPIGSGTSYGDDNSIFIGKLFWDNDYLKGMIDDIRIYDCVLSKSEIDSLYHEGSWVKYICLKTDSTDAIIGDTVKINIMLSNVNSLQISSAELKIAGYSTGLDFLGLDTTGTLTGSAGWSYSVNEVNDSLVISWFAGANDITSDGIFCKLKFKVTGDICTFVPISIQSAVFNTGQDSVLITNGGVYIKPIPEYGDVDENGIVQAYDASLILKHVVKLDTLFCQGLANADVTANDKVTALDASIILQYGVGLINHLPYDTSVNGSLAASGEFSMEKEIGTIGGLFEIPILIKDGNNIYSFEGCLEYDPECLIFSEFSLPSDKSNYQIQFNDKNGKIQWAGAGISPDGTEGIFINACFRYNPVAGNDNTEVYLRKIKINEEDEITNVDQTTVYIAGGIFNQNELPKEYSLNQNYPNPFNPVTTISYALPQKSYVTLTIYDINGRTVAVLVNQSQNAGYYSTQWDATNVGSGIYFYRILADRFTDIKKCIILK